MALVIQKKRRAVGDQSIKRTFIRHRFIFPEDNPDEMTETEMKEIGWLDNLQSIEENEDEGNEDIELIKKLEYLTNAEWNYVPTEQRKEWIPF
jgi:hypothetical protein